MIQIGEWQAEAEALLTKSAISFAATLETELAHSALEPLGTVLNRLPACAIYSTITLPPPMRPRFSFGLAYLIQWLYALDTLMDSCPSITYADDFTLLLGRHLANTPAHEAEFRLTNNPEQQLPNLDFSLATLVQTIEPLRERLRAVAADPSGPAAFDHYLMRVVRAMTTEASWRLLGTWPTLEEYLKVATITISGALCLWSINALLPNPNHNWQVSQTTAALADYGARLANDLATRQRDELEGKPNAVNLLLPHCASLEDAEQQISQRIDQQLQDLRRAAPPNPCPTTSQQMLDYYIYYSLVIARFMYQRADFAIQGANQ